MIMEENNKNKNKKSKKISNIKKEKENKKDKENRKENDIENSRNISEEINEYLNDADIRSRKKINYYLYINRIIRDLPTYPIKKLEYYKELDRTIPKIFVPVKSNKQISTFYNAYLKNPELLREWYYRLLILLSTQYNLNDSFIVKLLKKNDEIIYKTLQKYTIKRTTHTRKENLILNSQFVNYILTYNKKYRLHNYLDVGCGFCFKTPLVGKILGIKRQNIYGLNVEDDNDPYANINKGNKFINMNTYKVNEEFPYEDNFFSFMSFNMVLHHVDDIDWILKQAYKKLKPNGLLLIMEHDSPTDFDKIICDVLHLNSYKDYDIPNTNSTGNYISWLEFNYLLTSHGFKLLRHELSMKYKDTMMNVAKVYFNLYRKI